MLRSDAGHPAVIGPDPPWMRFLNRNRLRGVLPSGVGATRPRFGVDGARVATPEERARTLAAPSLLERIQTSAGNVARQVAENPLRTAADLTPGVGDVLALKDAAGFAKEGRPWMAGLAAASVIPGVPSLVRGGKQGGSVLADALAREGGALSVLHNTRASNLEGMGKLGGIPAPSLAITRESNPFQNYGDVTLIGTREMADPRYSVVFDGDSYSPRQPKPVYEPLHRPLRDRLIKDYRAMSDDDGWRANVWEALHSKNPDPAAFASAAVTSTGGSEAFLRSRGVPVVGGSSQRELDELIAAVAGVRPDEASEVVRAWAKEEITPWIGSPVVKVGKRNVPYTLENVTDAMTRSGKVRNQENGMTFGPGKLAASQLKRLKTPAALDRAAADRLRDEAAEGAAKAATDKVWDQVVAEVLPSYAYPGDTWGGLNDINDALSRVTKANPTDGEIRSALAGRDFRGVTPEGIAAARQYLEAIREVPQAYFEAKPMRGVKLGEFPGAVVPNESLSQAQDILGPHGVDVRGTAGTQRSPERQEAVAVLRRELAEKGYSTLFQLGAVGAAGLLAKYGFTMDDPEVDDL